MLRAPVILEASTIPVILWGPFNGLPWESLLKWKRQVGQLPRSEKLTYFSVGTPGNWGLTGALYMWTFVWGKVSLPNNCIGQGQE